MRLKGGIYIVTLALLVFAGGMATAQEPIQALDTSIESIVDEATQERDQVLAQREAELAEREARLTRMRTDLEALIARNEALRKELTERQAKIDTANTNKMRKLIKMYEAMSAEEAAPILSGMKEPVAPALFAGMKGKSAAAIMEYLPKAQASRFGEKLAKAN